MSSALVVSRGWIRSDGSDVGRRAGPCDVSDDAAEVPLADGARAGTSAAAMPTLPTPTITAPSTALQARRTRIVRRRGRLRCDGAAPLRRAPPGPVDVAAPR